MNSTWLVALHEYRRNVLKKSFILVMLSVPFMLALSIGVGLFIEYLQTNDAPVGYLDEAGLLPEEVKPVPLEPNEKPLEFIAFQTDAEARAALLQGDLQVYFTLAEDYAESRHIIVNFTKKPGDNAYRQFYNFLQSNLMVGVPETVAYRAAIGTDVTVRSFDGGRLVPSGGPTFTIFVPIMVTTAFMALLLMTSGYLLSAVADEKENRTVEILVTSISPGQLLGGKVIGIVGIGITLLASWVLVALIAIFLAAQLGVSWFQNLEMDWGIVIGAAAIALPAYVLVCGLMAALGSIASTTQEGQSLSSIFIILHILPTYMSWIFISSPNGPVSVALSLLPFTALVSVGMRNIFAVVPAWQILVSALIQTLCAVFAVWLAGRAFRLGMLRYGQRISWRRLFRA